MGLGLHRSPVGLSPTVQPGCACSRICASVGGGAKNQLWVLDLEQSGSGCCIFVFFNSPMFVSNIYKQALGEDAKNSTAQAERTNFFPPLRLSLIFIFILHVFKCRQRLSTQIFSARRQQPLPDYFCMCVHCAHTRMHAHTHTQRELSFTTLLVRLSHLKPAGKKNKKSAHTHKKKDNFRWTERNAYFLKEWPYVSHLLWENVCCENYLLQMYCTKYAFFFRGEKKFVLWEQSHGTIKHYFEDGNKIVSLEEN